MLFTKLIFLIRMSKLDELHQVAQRTHTFCTLNHSFILSIFVEYLPCDMDYNFAFLQLIYVNLDVDVSNMWTFLLYYFI